jgi:SAM-dependent methyltransferase
VTSSQRGHQNRARAESFGAVAARYDRIRPDYPPAALDALLASAPADALDIGIGTGKLARLLTDRGVAVTGVEIDEDMAVVARGYGLRVDVASFESWAPHGAHFDLITAAQAWHWIDPVIAIPKAAGLLRPGGLLALLWNYPQFDDRTQAVLDRVYAAAAPELSRSSVLRGAGPATVPIYLDQLVSSAEFASVEHRRFPWDQVYSGAEWLELTSTHSDHLVLDPTRLDRLLADLGAAIDALGGSVTARYVTEAVLARAR